MTNIKMLENIYLVINQLPNDQRATVNQLIEKKVDLNKSIGSAESLLAALILSLKADIVAEEARKNGKNNQLKAIKSILKAASKQQNKALHFVKTIDGHQYVGDGRILAKTAPIGDFKECPEDLNYPDVERFFDEKYGAALELVIPDAAKLRAYIKDQTAKNKANRSYIPLYNFGVGQPLVNARLLATAMDIMEGEFTIHCIKERTPLCFKDCKGNEVLLMPIRKRDGFVDVATEL